MSMPTFHTLQIKEKIQETDDTVSLVFDIPPDLSEAFHYQAGQYLTLLFKVGGQDARRAYSMSSAPQEEGVKVSVKRVEGGLVSNHIHDRVRTGDTVQVMPPEGRFTPVLNEEHRKTYYLFAAGSGITPIISITKTVLEAEPQSSVYLLYGSRNEGQIIFKSELDRLERQYAGQFRVDHIISQPSKVKAGGVAGFLGKKRSTWQGLKGRIDRKHCAEYLEEQLPTYPDCEYFICGPGNMTQTIRDVLTARGVSKGQVHFELFLSDKSGEGTGGTHAENTAPCDSRVKVKLGNQVVETTVPANKTILEALLDNSVEVPYSCMTGACSTCVAKISEGKVVMDTTLGLDDDEVAEGYILTCQAKPITTEVELDYGL